MEWILGLAALAFLLASKAAPVVSDVEQAINKSAFQQAFLAAAAGVDFRGIPIAFALAQAQLETGNGTGNVYKHTNNLFSITAWTGWNGDKWTAGNGTPFRKYPTLADSMRDWVRLMHTSHYAPALTYALTNNFPAFASKLKALGYDASSPTYASDLVATFDKNKADGIV